MYGRPFKTLQDFMALAYRAAIKPGTYKEVYYCLSTQNSVGKQVHGEPIAYRHARSALLLKSLYVDVDVKEKGYASLDEAKNAVSGFSTAAGLPPPSALVASGGGLHCYWISDKPLTQAEWRPYAEGLRAEIQKHGLKCDAGITTDAARLMRVPGSFNNKIPGQPRPVVLEHLGDSYDFATESGIARLATLSPVVTTPVTNTPFDLSAFPPGGMLSGFKGLSPTDNLSAGIEPINLPLVFDQKVQGCNHLKDCVDTGGKLHAEPLWQLSLLAASFFENGEALAHAFSKGYPTYDQEETQAKYEQKLQQKAQNNLGWPSCSAFEAAGAACKTCPFHGKIKSPLSLAARVSQTLTPVILPSVDLCLPENYFLNQKGWICEIVQKKVGDAYIDNMVELFMCQIREPILQAGRRAFLAETSLDQNKWGPVTLVEESLYNDQAMLRQLRQCGIKTNVRNEGRIRHFMTSWMQKLDEAKARIQTVPFGWLRADGGLGEEIGFAYGGKVFLFDGTEQRAGYADAQIERFYRPRGERSPWYKALKMITDQHRPANEAIIAITFAGPLILFTGKNNCVGNAWSNESGAQKSTAQYIGLSVWGHPRLTKESAMSSKKGIVHKLGQLKHLPVYWDEISDDNKMDQVRDLLGVSTEGRGATLLTQARNFFDTDEWETIILVGSNRSLIQNILRNTKGTDAPLQRVFEFEVPSAPDTMFEGDASIMIKTLESNYGQIGLDYAKYLGNHPKEVRDYVRKVYERFCRQVNHHSSERFRAAMAASIYAGAEIANKQLGATFNLGELWEWLKGEYLAQRDVINNAEVVGGSNVNTTNVITQFFKAHTRNALWLETIPMKKVGRPDPISYLAGPRVEHPDPIHIRLATHERVIQISRERLMIFLKNVNQPGASIISGLNKHFNATEIPKVNLAAGAGVMGGPEHIINIPVPPGSPFVEELFRHTAHDKRPEDAQIPEPPAAAVTAPVTVATNGSGKPISGMVEAAIQAAQDLAVVRGVK